MSLPEELRRGLAEIEMANGFCNRFLFVAVRRSKLLPTGGSLVDEDFRRLGRLCRDALLAARKVQTVRRSPAAEDLWAHMYAEMAEKDPGGMLGAMLARSEAQLLRLSIAYALTDGSSTIEVDHLAAAWDAWGYVVKSTRYIFGDSIGDEWADRLLAAIRKAGPDGLDGTQQRDLFARHASKLDQKRAALEARGLIVTRTVPTDGRPRLVSYATEAIKATEGRDSRNGDGP